MDFASMAFSHLALDPMIDTMNSPPAEGAFKS